MQKTVTKEFDVKGVGLHSGVFINMSIHPAPADHGIVFKRTDLPTDNAYIPARWDHVVNTKLCTVIGNNSGAVVKTIEHLMAALHGCGIDNALIEVDGPEVPAVDGSALPFVKLIRKAGIEVQDKPRRAIQILEDIHVADGDSSASLSPSESQCFISNIDFNHPMIRQQRFAFDLAVDNFDTEIAPARTFGFVDDVKKLREMGLALGGSPENAIALDGDGIVAASGEMFTDVHDAVKADALRFTNEFSRHKDLDSIGDLALAGAPIIGTYESFSGGHRVNSAVLKKMFSTPGSYRYIYLYDNSFGMQSLPYAEEAVSRSRLPA